MKTILLKVDYRDNTGKFWFDSYIKNQLISYDPENENIHQVICRVCDDEGMTITHKGKPIGNIYRDKVDGGSMAVGYLYRGKSVIQDRNMTKPQTGFFDVWVTIHTVNEFELEIID